MNKKKPVVIAFEIETPRRVDERECEPCPKMKVEFSTARTTFLILVLRWNCKMKFETSCRSHQTFKAARKPLTDSFRETAKGDRSEFRHAFSSKGDLPNAPFFPPSCNGIKDFRSSEAKGNLRSNEAALGLCQRRRLCMGKLEWAGDFLSQPGSTEHAAMLHNELRGPRYEMTSTRALCAERTENDATLSFEILSSVTHRTSVAWTFAVIGSRRESSSISSSITR